MTQDDMRRMKVAAGLDPNQLLDDPDDLPAFVAAVRNAALEEAAALCDRSLTYDPGDPGAGFARDIRTLKSSNDHP